MSSYKKAPAEVGQIVERMLEKYHTPLKDAGVTVDCLLAFPNTDENGDSVGPAIKHQGYAANAVVRVVNLRDRTKGMGDVEIIVDGEQWDTWSADQKDALIDHELEHLELREDKDGLIIRDDLNRPKLRIRKHDHQFGWFDSVARRHGKASFEVAQYERFQEAHRQQWLPFMGPGEQSDEVSGTRGPSTGEPKDGEVSSVKISGCGQSVTLTPASMKKLAGNIRKAGFAGKPSKSKGHRSGARMAASSK